MGECVILVGLPAAGKTTFYRARFSATHRHVSKDRWPRASNKDARQAAQLREALRAGVPVVVDNTNPSVADRAAVIAIAREFGARIVGYYLTASTREAVGRNRGREGPLRVPDVAIFATAKRLAAPVRSEGFDELYGVGIGEDGSYEITALP